MKKLFWLVTIAVLCGNVSAQVVKCRDAAGKVQFAERCPSGWTKTKDVSTLSALETTNAEPSSWQQRETQFQIRQNDRRGKELADRKEKEVVATECANARRRLEILQGGTPLITKGAFTKDPEYLSDSQRALEVERQNRMLLGCR